MSQMTPIAKCKKKNTKTKLTTPQCQQNLEYHKQTYIQIYNQTETHKQYRSDGSSEYIF